MRTQPASEKAGFDRKLAEILSAAAEVFAEQGYDRASIRLVAERAGISVPGIYHYVRSKQELLFQIQHRVFHDLVEQYNADSRAQPDAAARLELLIRNHLERFLANLPELIVCSREIDRLEGAFHERVQAKQREYFSLALGLFKEIGERYGALRVDPRTAALAMFGTINWVHTWYRPRAGPSAASMAGEFARIYLRGVLPEEAEAARPPAPAKAARPPRSAEAEKETGMFERFEKIYRERHEYAREWKKRTGGKVLGYFCTYVPEEILYAADVLPVRVLGSHEPQDVTEPHIFGMFCPFCRDCLAQGLKNRFDYLDGLAIAQSCLHIRQAYTSWVKHRPLEFSYYLNMPHKVKSPRAKTFLAGELLTFKRAVEKWTGKTITDDKLREGIRIMNRNREVMHELYAARRAEPPPLTGAEALQVVLAMQMSDKREHTELVESVLPRLAGRQPPAGGSGTRLLIVGSEDDDLEFFRMVEKVGGVIVTDEHCTGTRYFWNKVEIDGLPPLQAIANRYCDRPPCPTKDWEERDRVAHILALAREWSCRGAIVIQQKFCDPHELDMPAIKKGLEAAGIPVLLLEFDVTVPVGQFQIRVEAFLEMLEADELFYSEENA